MKQFKVALALFCLLLSLVIGFDRIFHPPPRHRFFNYQALDALPEKNTEPVQNLDELQKILDQPFSLYGKGVQSFVFISQDGQYILKFFKKPKISAPSWFSQIPHFPFLHETYLKRMERKEFIFDSCRNVDRFFKEECGVVYIHLNRTHQFKKRTTVINRRGSTVDVDMDGKVFILQKKADLIYPRIEELMAEGRTDKAKAIVTQVFELMRHFTAAGVTDHDPVVHRNFGLIADRAVQIDIGIMKMEPEKKVNCIEINMRTFKKWIDNTYPELSDHFQEEIKKSELL